MYICVHVYHMYIYKYMYICTCVPHLYNIIIIYHNSILGHLGYTIKIYVAFFKDIGKVVLCSQQLEKKVQRYSLIYSLPHIQLFLFLIFSTTSIMHLDKL